METILVLEDDECALQAIRNILSLRGSEVLEARSDAAAVQILRDYAGPIDVLIAAVGYHGTHGDMVSCLAWDSRPGLPVLLTASLPVEVLVHQALLDPEILNDSRVKVLEKPFTATAMLGRVDVLLQAAAARAGRVISA